MLATSMCRRTGHVWKARTLVACRYSWWPSCSARSLGTLATVAAVLVGVPVGALAIKVALAVLRQDSYIYPRHSLMLEPERRRTDVDEPVLHGGFEPSAVSRVRLEAADGVELSAFFFEATATAAAGGGLPVLLYLQGNYGNPGHRLALFKRLQRDVPAHVFALSYRGFGDSDGSPSEVGLNADADAALALLRGEGGVLLEAEGDALRRVLAKNPKPRVVAFGSSLGGAVAISLAARKQLDGLIVENSFTSIGEVIDHMFPKWTVYGHLKPFLRSGWHSDGAVGRVPTNLPTLFVSGTADSDLPPRMMHTLLERCGSRRKALFEVQGGTHNDTWKRPGYCERIGEFLELR